MAVEALLRADEQEWKGSLDNLCKRFSQLDSAVVLDTLRQNEGHAGRTAQALRKLSPAAEATTTPSAPPVKAVATSPSPAKAAATAPPPAKATAAPAAAKKVPAVKEAPPATKAAVAEPELAVKASPELAAQAPPPPDSKLIFVAALQGDVQQLNHLIAARADLNGRYTGRPATKEDKIIDATPLHLVVTMGKADVAEILLRHGADFEAKMRRALGSGKPPAEQYEEMTPLHLAAMEGHTNIVEMLVAQGANKAAQMKLVERNGDAVQERTITPLQIAQEMVSKGHSRDSVISLLSK